MAAYIDKSDQPATAPTATPLPLGYAVRETKAPFDWWAAVRQVIFAHGAAFTAGGFVDWLMGYQGWTDNQVLWVAFGIGMMTLVIPWPGGFRRMRSRRD